MDIYQVLSGEDAHGIQWAFVAQNERMRPKQWVTAIQDYNKSIANFPNLHINLGGGQYNNEPILVGSSRDALKRSIAYRYIKHQCKKNRVEWCDLKKTKKTKDITDNDDGQDKIFETPATEQEQPKVLHFL